MFCNHSDINNKTIFSFEVFPPKKNMPIDTIFKTLDELRDLRPDFISVTFGAGGSENCDNALAIAKRIQDECKVESVIHMPAINMTKDDAQFCLEQFQNAGIENILALRGDKVEGKTPCKDFPHASDLISFIKEFDSKRKDGKHFNILGACYPEMHPESAHITDDILHLKEKVDAGLHFLTTQMFFDNNVYFHFLSRLRDAGVTVPVIAGIMPVTNGKQIKRICDLAGTYLPPRFRAIVDRFGDDPVAMLDAGVAYATEQIIDLFANGVNFVHVYTMNKPEIARRVMGNLKGIVSGS